MELGVFLMVLKRKMFESVPSKSQQRVEEQIIETKDFQA